MPQALKGYWQVSAGVVLGKPIDTCSRAWHYHSSDYEADAILEPGEVSRFEDMRAAALDYAASLMDPRRVNWVKLEFVWL